MSQLSWIPYTLTAALFLGISTSLYKIPAAKKYSSYHSTIWSNAFAFLFVIASIILFIPGGLRGQQSISWYGLMWGVMFALTMIFQKSLVKKVETNSAFPVTSSLGSVVTVLVGVLLLSETISFIQVVGILCIIFSVYFFTSKNGSFLLNKETILLALGSITASTISKYIQKMGAVHDSVVHFMLYQYFGAALFAIVVALFFERSKIAEVMYLKRYWKGSVLIGFFTALGGYAIIKALSIGPLSGVYAIHPSYTLIAALFGVVFFREKLTTRKIALIFLTIIGVVLIKIG